MYKRQGKEHEFQLDFPKLMTRSQAIRTKKRGVKINDIFLSNTDFTGRVGSLFSPILNYFNSISIVRWMMQKMIGIHSERILTKFNGSTFKNWFDGHNTLIKNPIDKVVIFGTCFTNAHDVELGKAAVKILEHNNKKKKPFQTNSSLYARRNSKKILYYS